MGQVYYGVHEKLATFLRARYDLSVFVETGALAGDSAVWASNNGFEKVYTIEIDESRWTSLQERFKTYPNIVLKCGKSQKLLVEVLGEIKEKALIFLDAHAPAQRDDEHPVLIELTAIKKCPLEHIIMIDDAFYFDGRGNNWPAISAITNILEDTGRVCHIYDDVILATYSRNDIEEYISGLHRDV